MVGNRIAIGVLAAFALVLAGCANGPRTGEGDMDLQNEAQAALRAMTATDAGVSNLIDNAAGYAIFPNAGRGGLVAGGSYGRGQVYEHGELIGQAKLEQASLGALAGGEKFRELIVFKTPDALNRFKDNQLSLGANAAALILKSGAAKGALAEKDVVVFIDPLEGAIVDASVSGQRFVFEPEEGVGRVNPESPTTQPSRRHTEIRTESRTETR